MRVPMGPQQLMAYLGAPSALLCWREKQFSSGADASCARRHGALQGAAAPRVEDAWSWLHQIPMLSPRTPPPPPSARRSRCRSRRESRMSGGIRHCVNSPPAGRVQTQGGCSESGGSCGIDELVINQLHMARHTARQEREKAHRQGGPTREHGRTGGRTLAAACSAVRATAAAAALGELGGEKVGDGDEGVGGNAVSFHTRRSISCSPSAAARVSRSSSAAESSPLPSSSRWRSRA